MLQRYSYLSSDPPTTRPCQIFRCRHTLAGSSSQDRRSRCYEPSLTAVAAQWYELCPDRPPLSNVFSLLSCTLTTDSAWTIRINFSMMHRVIHAQTNNNNMAPLSQRHKSLRPPPDPSLGGRPLVCRLPPRTICAASNLS